MCISSKLPGDTDPAGGYGSRLEVSQLGSQHKSGPLPVWGNTALLIHSHICLLLFHLWLLLCCHGGVVTATETMTFKIFTIQSFTDFSQPLF